MQQGRVKSLGIGLDSCRSGDLAGLQRAVEVLDWDPRTACDRHGSGPLIWAAGGGHLACCKYLVEACGGLVATDQAGRRGCVLGF